MKQYHHIPRPDRPQHQAGEVVLGMAGNWIEDPQATGKVRPWVLLQTGDGQHLAVGLTSKAVYRTTGGSRPEVPHDPGTGLEGDRSYLWSSRPSRLSRAGVHRHLGWASRQMIDLISRHVQVPRHVVEHLRSTAHDDSTDEADA